MTKPKQAVDLAPMYCSTATAAAFLDVGLSRLYELLDAQLIESRYEGRMRKVLITSLREYGDRLPSDPPEAS